MGIGTFRDSFHGTGGSFTVPCFGDSMDCADFIRDRIAGLAGELGLPLPPLPYRAPASFDREFALLLGTGSTERGVLEIGLRDWGDDLVVAVAAANHEVAGPSRLDILFDPALHAGQLLREGYDPKEYAAMAKAFADDLLCLVRLDLHDCGIECRRPTGLYTTAIYEPPQDLKADREDYLGRVAGHLAYFNAPYPVEASSATREGRIGLTKAVLSMLDDDPRFGGMHVQVPLLSPDGEVLIFDGFGSSSLDDPEPWGHIDVDQDELLTFFPDGIDLEPSTLAPLPRTDATEAWWVRNQVELNRQGGSAPILFIPADEFAEATGHNVNLDMSEYADDDRPPGP